VDIPKFQKMSAGHPYGDAIVGDALRMGWGKFGAEVAKFASASALAREDYVGERGEMSASTAAAPVPARDYRRFGGTHPQRLTGSIAARRDKTVFGWRRRRRCVRRGPYCRAERCGGMVKAGD
jgi:hypothetical protein